MRCLQLPFRFDPERLRADLARVAPSEWIAHQQKRHYDGQWSGVALRSVGGASDNILPETREAEAFHGTALLARCPYFQEVLATFRCPQHAVRLLRLHAGSNIAEHVDRALDFDEGEVRLHVPIVTSEAVKFFLDGARLVMAPGECWYTNVNLPHSVENHGAIDRIHLVIDCAVDDWLRDLFARTPPPPGAHYAARLTLATAPTIEAVLACFTSATAPGIAFRAEGRTLVLAWAGRHAWQLRLRLPDLGPSQPLAWVAHLESSPDPERKHREDYVALLDRCTRVLPGVAITAEGLA